MSTTKIFWLTTHDVINKIRKEQKINKYGKQKHKQKTMKISDLRDLNTNLVPEAKGVVDSILKTFKFTENCPDWDSDFTLEVAKASEGMCTVISQNKQTWAISSALWIRLQYLNQKIDIPENNIPNIDFFYGIVVTLEKLSHLGKLYISGYMVERVQNEKKAIWVVFNECQYPYKSFQYCPGGNWQMLDTNNNVVG